MQAEFYDHYITNCLTKQCSARTPQKKIGKSVRDSFRLKPKQNTGIKYSAAELTKKGVLLEIIDEDIKAPYRGVQVKSQSG